MQKEKQIIPKKSEEKITELSSALKKNLLRRKLVKKLQKEKKDNEKLLYRFNEWNLL